eukprot:6464778-Amphidinium_carterae.2
MQASEIKHESCPSKLERLISIMTATRPKVKGSLYVVQIVSHSAHAVFVMAKEGRYEGSGYSVKSSRVQR